MSHQRGQGESDHLDAAVVVALWLKVLVLTRVTPGHRAGTVPAGCWDEHTCTDHVTLQRETLPELLHLATPLRNQSLIIFQQVQLDYLTSLFIEIYFIIRS